MKLKQPLKISFNVSYLIIFNPKLVQTLYVLDVGLAKGDSLATLGLLDYLGDFPTDFLVFFLLNDDIYRASSIAFLLPL